MQALPVTDDAAMDAAAADSEAQAMDAEPEVAGEAGDAVEEGMGEKQAEASAEPEATVTGDDAAVSEASLAEAPVAEEAMAEAEVAEEASKTPADKSSNVVEPDSESVVEVQESPKQVAAEPVDTAADAEVVEESAL